MLLGYTGLMGQFAFGRSDSNKGPMGSFKKALETRNKSWGGFLGIIPVVGAFGIAVGYAVVVGWFLRFLGGFITGSAMSAADSGVLFWRIGKSFWKHNLAFISAYFQYQIVLITQRIPKGPETMNKIMMPAFYILFVIVMVRVFMLDGAFEGIKYLVVPKMVFFNGAQNLDLCLRSGIFLTFTCWVWDDSLWKLSKTRCRYHV